jgi:hypothetical protein
MVGVALVVVGMLAVGMLAVGMVVDGMVVVGMVEDGMVEDGMVEVGMGGGVRGGGVTLTIRIILTTRTMRRLRTTSSSLRYMSSRSLSNRNQVTGISAGIRKAIIRT